MGGAPVSEAAVDVGSRGRVVMLVANAVRGDSRVQKMARSMAERGWETVLLGCTFDSSAVGKPAEEFWLGGARVVLVPVPALISGQRNAVSSVVVSRQEYRRAAARCAIADLEDASAGGRSLPGRVRASAAARLFLGAHPAVDSQFGRLTGSRAGRALKAGVCGIRGALDRQGGWRALNPRFRDVELALEPWVRALRPDLVHAHDFHMVGVAARLAARLSPPQRGVGGAAQRAAARPVRWVYDAHEYLAGIEVPPWRQVRARMRRRMLVGLEREFIGRADAVVTVSAPIAERLVRDHGLRQPVEVVSNRPAVPQTDGAPHPDVRRAAGLGPDVPVLVYSGGLAPKRGLGTVVDALPSLEQAHLVLVVRRRDPDLAALLRRVAQLGLQRRVHVVDYVAPEQVVGYVRAATVGVVPLLHRPNHELSLITKYFEYLAAGLPILSSDVREMARATRQWGVGEVFRAGDPVSLTAAARRLLAAPQHYRAAYGEGRPAAEYLGDGWTQQAVPLHRLYQRLAARGTKDG